MPCVLHVACTSLIRVLIPLLQFTLAVRELPSSGMTVDLALKNPQDALSWQDRLGAAGWEDKGLPEREAAWTLRVPVFQPKGQERTGGRAYLKK